MIFVNFNQEMDVATPSSPWLEEKSEPAYPLLQRPKDRTVLREWRGEMVQAYNQYEMTKLQEAMSNFPVIGKSKQLKPALGEYKDI